MKKKICIITSSFPINEKDSSNAGVFVKDFSSLLSLEGYDVSVLTPKKTNSTDDFESIKVHFFPWIGGESGLSSLNPKNPIHFFRLVSAVFSGLVSTISFIKKNQTDVCFAMWAVPSGIFALAAKIFLNKPYFVWALGSDIWNIQDYPLGNFILKKILKNSQKLFADGFKLAQSVEKISHKKCEFLASSRLLENINKQPEYTKFDPTKKNFMYLGRYHPNKGIDLLIEAIHILNSEYKKKTLFHIFGGGPLKNKIKHMVNKLDLKNFVFINDYLASDKVFSYMSKTDFVIIPSRIESIPLVLSDALQSNRPTITTNVGDMGTLVQKYKVGIIVEPTAESIAEGIQTAVESEHKIESFREGMAEFRKLLDLKQSVKSFKKDLDIFINNNRIKM